MLIFLLCHYRRKTLTIICHFYIMLIFHSANEYAIHSGITWRKAKALQDKGVLHEVTDIEGKKLGYIDLHSLIDPLL